MAISNSVSIVGSSLSKPIKSETASKTKKTFGFQYPVGKTSSKGYFVKESGIELAKNLIRQIIRTEKGERLMLPNFGCGLKRFLFEPLGQPPVP